MKIAVTYEKGIVFQHFGKCEQFLIAEVSEHQIVQKSLLSSEGQGHSALVGLLQNAGVNVLICGGCGQGARDALQQAGIVLISGAKGNAEAALTAYLQGSLQDDPSLTCHHHEGEHSCGNHSCKS